MAESLLPDILFYDSRQPASYPHNGRTLTDDVMDGFIALLTNGRVTRDGVEPHRDLLPEFPYLGPPTVGVTNWRAQCPSHLRRSPGASIANSTFAIRLELRPQPVGGPGRVARRQPHAGVSKIRHHELSLGSQGV